MSTIVKTEHIYGKGLVQDQNNPTTYIEKELKLFVFKKSNNTETFIPTLIKIHGGGFVDGDEMDFYEFTTYYVEKGFQVIAIDYRLGPEKGLVPSEWNTTTNNNFTKVEEEISKGNIPSREEAGGLPLSTYITKEVLNGGYMCIRDVKAAIRYLTRYKVEFNIDVNKVFMMGESAGALASFAYAFVQQGDYSKYFFKDTVTYEEEDTTLNDCNPDVEPFIIQYFIVYSGSTMIIDQLEEAFNLNIYNDESVYPSYLYMVHDPKDNIVSYDKIKNFYDNNSQNPNYTLVATFDGAGHVPSQIQYIKGAYDWTESINQQVTISEQEIQDLFKTKSNANQISSSDMTTFNTLLNTITHTQAKNNLRRQTINQLLALINKNNKVIIFNAEDIGFVSITGKTKVRSIKHNTSTIIDVTKDNLNNEIVYCPLEIGEHVEFKNLPFISDIIIKCIAKDKYQITKLENDTNIQSINTTLETLKNKGSIRFEDKTGLFFTKLDHYTLYSGDIVVINNLRFIIGSVAFDGIVDDVNVCFLQGTKIKTDQGITPVERINNTHTIKNYPVRALIKGHFTENTMVRIKKDTFNPNIPNCDTYVTPCHSLYIDNKFILAGRLVNTIKGISFVTMKKNPMVYNILFDEWLVINANGLPVESLHPKSKILQNKNTKTIEYFDSQ